MRGLNGWSAVKTGMRCILSKHNMVRQVRVHSD